MPKPPNPPKTENSAKEIFQKREKLQKASGEPPDYDAALGRQIKESRTKTNLLGENIIRKLIIFLFFVFCGGVCFLVVSFSILLTIYFLHIYMDMDMLVAFLRQAWAIITSAALGAYVSLLIFLIKRRDK